LRARKRPGSEKLHPAAEEKFALAPAGPETRIALLLLTIPLGVLSLVGVAAGISDPAELPGVLAVLGGVVPVTVLLAAVFCQKARTGGDSAGNQGVPGEVGAAV